MFVALLALLSLPVEPGSRPVAPPQQVPLPSRLAQAAQDAGCMPAGLAGHWVFDVAGGKPVRWKPAPPAGVAACLERVLPAFPRDLTHVILVYPPRAH